MGYGGDVIAAGDAGQLPGPRLLTVSNMNSMVGEDNRARRKREYFGRCWCKAWDGPMGIGHPILLTLIRHSSARMAGCHAPKWREVENNGVNSQVYFAREHSYIHD
jgi:hypothetical protein